MPSLFRSTRIIALTAPLVLSPAGLQGALHAQSAPRTQWSVAAEYSNNSNKLLVGESGQRKWAALTFGYARRIVAGRGVSLSYFGELRPLVAESDPVTTNQYTYTGPIAVLFPPSTPQVLSSCTSGVQAFPVVDPNDGSPAGSIVVTTQCSRRWTYGGAISPAGIRLNAFTAGHLQPYVLGTLGVVLTTRPIPAQDGTRCNFLIQAGVGLQLYRTRSRSVFAEYRIQHISNDDRSSINPGIDSQLVRIGLQFGR